MSKRLPIEVRKLCRKIQPFIQARTARQELARACGIRHRQQMNRSFPRRGAPPITVRLTADSALAALRWLEERPNKEKCLYVPSWKELRGVGKLFIKRKGLVAYLASKIGGGISEDQIYSYFSSGRRKPDGEFALRFFVLTMVVSAVKNHSKLGPLLPRCIVEGLSVMARPGLVRQQQIGREMYCFLKPPLPRRGQTFSNMIKFRGKNTHVLGVLLGVGPKTDLSKYASLWKEKR